jgi:hypothetical protein
MRTISAPKTDNQRLNEFLDFIYSFLNLAPTFRQRREATSTTLTAADFYLGITDTTAARTVNLPPLNSVPLEQLYIVKDESGNASVNNITIDGNGTEQIDGALTRVINNNYGAVGILRGATAWFTWIVR